MDTGIGEDLRWLFISFLFATVTSEIASKFSGLLREWRKLGPGKFPALSHAVLAAVVVITSWIGWSLETMHHSYPHVTEVFGRPTLLLIVDFGLLTFYYALVKGIDVEACKGNARDPSLWSMLILAAYLLWDFLNGVVMNYPAIHFGLRDYVSVIGMLMAGFAFLCFKNISAERPRLVFVANVSLIFLFLSYRAMKQYATAVVAERRHLLGCVGLLLVFVLTMFIAAFGNRRAAKEPQQKTDS
jgi:hypothetical protein